MDHHSDNERMLWPLGAATEALLREAFAGRALLTAQEAAKILGMDPSTLAQATATGVISSTPISARSRRYSERDLRLFLTSDPVQGSPQQRPATLVSKAWTGPTFTEVLAAKRAAKKTTLS